MGRHRVGRDMTIEEFNAWDDEVTRTKRVVAASGEEGGPRVTRVPDPVSVKFMPPTDRIEVPAFPALADPPSPAPADPDSPGLADAAAPTFPHDAGPASAPAPVVSFDAAPSRRLSGWSTLRQRIFIETLAETGSVHVAAESAGLSARGAYALRLRSAAFAAAWAAALRLAAGRLAALAFDRAIYGRVEQVYHDGQLIGERRVPSERLLMWLLARLDPAGFAAPWERRPDDRSDPQAEARAGFSGMLGALADTPAFAARAAALFAGDDPDSAADDS